MKKLYLILIKKQYLKFKSFLIFDLELKHNQRSARAVQKLNY